MLKTLAVGLAVGLIAPISLSIALAGASDADTACWDQYDVQGIKRVGIVIPSTISRSDCTQPDHCAWEYDLAGRRKRLNVPYKASPRTCFSTVTRDTLAPGSLTTTTSVAASTTSQPTTTTVRPAAVSTTVATSSTAAPSTVQPAATTTVAPTTTQPASTTTTTTTTTTTVAPSTGPGGGDDFLETFTGNTGLERFKVEVYHRNTGSQILGQAPVIWGGNNAIHGGSWTADHDLSCGAPTTQRPLSSTRIQDTDGSNGWQPKVDFNLDEIVYLCRDHVMTSMGDVDAYSIVSFSPDQTFNSSTTTTVSWDVNVTDLGGRQWWEVVIVPLNEPHLATIEWMAGTAAIDDYGPGTIAIGNGPFGGTSNVTTNRTTRSPVGSICAGIDAADPEACASKAIRRSFSVTDNKNGTLTFSYLGQTFTYPGRFPDTFRVYFKDHNYTPDKDGPPAGHTWHWDNILIR